ncbi:MAG TPA: hypothetical protein VK168_13825 [Saprospiraceae bacterium]|nr:hypothetical protein [Saprospiraceae bacterium]
MGFAFNQLNWFENLNGVQVSSRYADVKLVMNVGNVPVDEVKCMGILFGRENFFCVLTKYFLLCRQPEIFLMINLAKHLFLPPNPEQSSAQLFLLVPEKSLASTPPA